MTWPSDPDDGPIGRDASSSLPAWPERDVWAPREYDTSSDAELAIDVSAGAQADADADANADETATHESVTDATAAPPPSTEPLETWDPRRQGERRRATTAEETVPWLIGIILALAGMVIVLVALIFANENGVLAGSRLSPLPAAGLSSGSPSASTTPAATPVVTDTPQPSDSSAPTVAPGPAYGAIEMAYLGRKTSSAPVYLWRRDFSQKEEPVETAIAEHGISQFCLAPDGSVSAVVVDGHVVAVDADGTKRPLFDGADAITFGADASTVYVAQIGRLSGKDRAQVFAVNFANATSRRLTDFTYAHPQIFKDPPVTEAAFADEGGQVRLWPTADGNLVLWILGAPGTYRIDPMSGERRNVTRTPTLVSPDGARRLEAKLKGSATTLTLYDRDDAAQASVKITGLVSHIRWAPNGSEVSFTLSTLGKNGGVVQNVYLWELGDGTDAMPLTSNGTSFGAEWLGAAQSWQP